MLQPKTNHVSYVSPQEIAPRPRPIGAGGPVHWAKKNLFNNWYNAVITLVALYFVIDASFAIVNWAFIQSVWTGEPQACAAAAGACWAAVNEKLRFILFGTYTFEEQWRPALAMAILFGVGFVSCFQRFWGRWLLALWGASLIVMYYLMAGGVFGLAYVPTTNWGGLPLTLGLAVVAIIFSFPLGILLALGRRSNMPIVKTMSVGYIELVRGVPLITVLFMASVLFPLFMPEGVTFDKLLRAQVGFILFSAAYMAEIVRGGLQAIPRGQYEAADSLGLGYWQKMRFIILPQALRLVIPPMVNNFISIFKDTALVLVIGIYDLLNSAKTAMNDPLWRAYYIEAYIFAAVIYFVICYFISQYSQRLEKQLHVGHHRR